METATKPAVNQPYYVNSQSPAKYIDDLECGFIQFENTMW